MQFDDRSSPGRTMRGFQRRRTAQRTVFRYERRRIEASRTEPSNDGVVVNLDELDCCDRENRKKRKADENAERTDVRWSSKDEYRMNE